VIAGSARGRPLRTLPGLEVRPTLDRVRQGVFSSLGELVLEAVFLDLFAGSGAVGIEALSRGASQSVFVESAAGCVRRLRENLDRCGFDRQARVLQCDWRAGVDRLLRGREAFDLIYADPPYGRFDEAAVLRELQALLLPEGRLLLEHPRRRALPAETGALRLARQMTYGQTAVSWYCLDPDLVDSLRRRQ
jgi:16S rRNA (guanine(966)-N(2))-methyltransferase RsmD